MLIIFGKQFYNKISAICPFVRLFCQKFTGWHQLQKFIKNNIILKISEIFNHWLAVSYGTLCTWLGEILFLNGLHAPQNPESTKGHWFCFNKFSHNFGKYDRKYVQILYLMCNMLLPPCYCKSPPWLWATVWEYFPVLPQGEHWPSRELHHLQISVEILEPMSMSAISVNNL